MNESTGVIVVGPAGSGTRVVTKILVDNNAIGSYGHKQPMDNDIEVGKAAFPTVPPSIYVVRRSLPHGREFPSIENVIEHYRRIGITDIRFVITYRSPLYTAFSQLYQHKGLVKDYEEGLDNVKKAVSFLDDFLKYANYPLIPVSYEMLIQFPKLIQRYICDSVGLLCINFVEIIDGNKKYEKN